MNCLCGEEMVLLWTLAPVEKKARLPEQVNLWACAPTGCGRIFLEASGFEMEGTWFTAEVNQRKDLL